MKVTNHIFFGFKQCHDINRLPEVDAGENANNGYYIKLSRVAPTNAAYKSSYELRIIQPNHKISEKPVATCNVDNSENPPIFGLYLDLQEGSRYYKCILVYLKRSDGVLALKGILAHNIKPEVDETEENSEIKYRVAVGLQFQNNKIEWNFREKEAWPQIVLSPVLILNNN